MPVMSFRVYTTPSLYDILLLRWLHPCSCGHQRDRQGAGSISRLLEAVPYGTCLLQWDALTPTNTLIPFHPFLCFCPSTYRTGQDKSLQEAGWKDPA